MNTDMAVIDPIIHQALRLPALAKVRLIERLMALLAQDLTVEPPLPLSPTEGAPTEGLATVDEVVNPNLAHAILSERDLQQQAEAEMRFKEELFKAGLLTQIANPAHYQRAKFKPVVIAGQPLSEQIIADRR